jgi:hypothetical protein
MFQVFDGPSDHYGSAMRTCVRIVSREEPIDQIPHFRGRKALTSLDRTVTGNDARNLALLVYEIPQFK